MEQRPFNASVWLNSELYPRTTWKRSKSITTSQVKQSKKGENFAINNFIPGWKGDGLFSRNSVPLRKIIFLLWQDSLSQLKTFGQVNRSLQSTIFQEFQNFLEFKKITIEEVKSFNELLTLYRQRNSQYYPILSEFFEIYCFQTISFYIFKIRFIVKLCQANRTNFKFSYLTNPTSFLNKTFERGGPFELNCPSLQLNAYSWYRPSIALKSQFTLLERILNEISISELMKVCTYNPNYFRPGASISSYIKFSHSMSHQCFGQFLNILLEKLPHWIDPSKETSRGPVKSFLKTQNRSVHTQFTGNYVTSLAHAYWLHQEKNPKDHNPLTHPTFEGSNFLSGGHVKLCHELQFLCETLNTALRTHSSPISYLCKAMKSAKVKKSINRHGQISMFPSDEEAPQSDIYDNIVLMLADFPKTNPHHYLLTQIYQQENRLSERGLLYVFSNKNLFLPSHSEKVEQLLLKYKLEATFDMEQLQGRGELPPHLYIFSKKSNTKAVSNYDWPKKSAEESCYTFKWSGTLSSFSKLEKYLSTLDQFFKKKTNSTPIYQDQMGSDLIFEYNLDAILEGKLLNNANDPNKITHPNFFRGLAKSCVPIDSFFKIEALSSTAPGVPKRNSITSELLGISFNDEDRFPFILIVNYSHYQQIGIEIISSDIYQAKLEQYGTAYFQYFGLLPKIHNLEIDLLRAFFTSPIGAQLVQIGLRGGPTKIKSKIKGLLVPKFLADGRPFPQAISSSIAMKHLLDNGLANVHPTQLKTSVQALDKLIASCGDQYTVAILNLLNKAHIEMLGLYNDIKTTGKSYGNINFLSPVLISSISQIPCKAIYPDNEDVFVELHIDGPHHIHLPLTQLDIKLVDKDRAKLTLISHENEILSLYSGPALISFLQFVLDQGQGHSISTILQNVRVPSLAEFEKVLGDFQQMADAIQVHLAEIKQYISQLFSKKIMNS